MISEIKKKVEYFLDVPLLVSTTGRYPLRGIYINIELENGKRLWFDGKLKEITDERWIRHLNNSLKQD